MNVAVAETRRRAFLLGALGVAVAGGVTIAFGAYQALWTVSAVVVTALLVAVAVEPLVARLSDRGLPRSRAVAVVATGFLVPTVAAAVLLLPVALGQVTAFLRDLASSFPDTTVVRYLTDQENSSAVVGGALAVGTSVWSMLSALVLVPVLAVYSSAALPAVRMSRFVTDDLVTTLGRFVAGRFLLAVVNAVVLGSTVALMGGVTPLAAGFVVLLTSFLPTVGILLGAVAVVLVCLPAGFVAVAVATAVTLGLVVLERQVVNPRWAPGLAAVPAVLLVLAMVAGALVAGGVGAFLAAPVVLAARSVLASRG